MCNTNHCQSQIILSEKLSIEEAQHKKLHSRIMEENAILKKQIQLEVNMCKKRIDEGEWRNNELKRKQYDLIQKLRDRHDEMDALRKWRNKEAAMDKSHIETLEYILEISKSRTDSIQREYETHIQETAKEKNHLDEQSVKLAVQKSKLKKSIKKHLIEKDELFAEQNRLELKEYLLKEDKEKVEQLKREYDAFLVNETKDILKERKDLQILQYELHEKEKALDAQNNIIEKEKLWMRNIYKSVAIAGFVVGCLYMFKNTKIRR